MREYFEASSRVPVLCATLLSTLILVVAVFPSLPISGEMIDVKAGYTHAEALAALDGYGEAGRRAYVWASLTLDTLLPIVYASFLGGLVYRFRPTERLWRLAYLPLAAVVIDLGENVQIFLMLTRYPDIPAAQVASASLFTLSKGYAFLICLALATTLAVVAGGRRARAGLRNRSSARGR